MDDNPDKQMGDKSKKDFTMNKPLTHGKYKIGDKKTLAMKAVALKRKWEEENQSMPTEWDSRRRKHVKRKPSWGYMTKTVHETFPHLYDLE